MGNVSEYRTFSANTRWYNLTCAEVSAGRHRCGARLDWDYDLFDQLTAAARTNSPNGAADAAYNYNWLYDLAGNHLHESRGQMGLSGNYNNLNQITDRDWSGKLDIWGSIETTNALWSVLVNSVASQQFNGTNYLCGAALAVGSNAVEIVYQDATVTNAETRALYAPPVKPQSFLWDALLQKLIPNKEFILVGCEPYIQDNKDKGRHWWFDNPRVKQRVEIILGKWGRWRIT